MTTFSSPKVITHGHWMYNSVTHETVTPEISTLMAPLDTMYSKKFEKIQSQLDNLYEQYALGVYNKVINLCKEFLPSGLVVEICAGNGTLCLTINGNHIDALSQYDDDDNQYFLFELTENQFNFIEQMNAYLRGDDCGNHGVFGSNYVWNYHLDGKKFTT